KCKMKNMMLAIIALALSSCYNRFTGNYNEFPDIHDSKNAIVEVSQKSLSDEAAERKRLREWNSMKPPEYRINPGDKLHVVVYNHPDLNMETIVTPDGCIGMVFVGQLPIKDMTLTDACKKIEETLSEFIRNPSVGITPMEIHSETVTIAGAVQKPGIYPIHDGMKLSDIYAKAGGSSVRRYDAQDLDAADLTKSVFIRDNKRVKEVDFARAIEQGDADYNIVLHQGDYIYIAVRSESMVCLVGDVGQCVKKIWDNNLGILELLTQANFVKETYWPYAIIIRGGIANPTLYKVDIDSILQGRKPNVRLLPNDIVYLPKDNISEFNVFVRKVLPTSVLINTIHGMSKW
ncbi:MAG: polysaccharide export protein, partial [Victivallales bacterium]|nr:polysaccharide export protein [Victivallales bacterium]